jgi:hypothetical protein
VAPEIELPVAFILGNLELPVLPIKKRGPGLLLPAPLSSTAKPLVICWVRSAAWAHKLTWTWWTRFPPLSLIGDLAGSGTITRRARAVRVSERRKGAQRQGHYQEGH